MIELLIGLLSGVAIGALMVLQLSRIKMDGMLRERERLRRMLWDANQTDAAVQAMRQMRSVADKDKLYEQEVLAEPRPIRGDRSVMDAVIGDIVEEPDVVRGDE